jgi:hypothetical protein
MKIRLYKHYCLIFGDFRRKAYAHKSSSIGCK